MNKHELVVKMAKDSGVTARQAEKALKTFFSAIEESLRKDGRVRFIGFGTFYVAERKARAGRNPRTGEPIKIPAKKVVRFRASKRLLDAVQ
jgi:DNA-binding protein HU-beta